MHAIVSVIDPEYYARIEALWQELELNCGLIGIWSTPIPHFSWHIAEAYEFNLLQPAIEQLSGTIRAFRVRTSGLGLFTRENPVIYFPIVRTALISSIHLEIWDRIIPISRNPSPYYAPELWMPHITLAHGDVSPTALACALEKLAFQVNAWEIAIDNLALVSQVEGDVGVLKYRVSLAG